MNLETIPSAIDAQAILLWATDRYRVPRLNPVLQLQQYSPSRSTDLGFPCTVAHRYRQLWHALSRPSLDPSSPCCPCNALRTRRRVKFSRTDFVRLWLYLRDRFFSKWCASEILQIAYRPTNYSFSEMRNRQKIWRHRKSCREKNTVKSNFWNRDSLQDLYIKLWFSKPHFQSSCTKPLIKIIFQNHFSIPFFQNPSLT